MAVAAGGATRQSPPGRQISTEHRGVRPVETEVERIRRHRLAALAAQEEGWSDSEVPPPYRQEADNSNEKKDDDDDNVASRQN